MRPPRETLFAMIISRQPTFLRQWRDYRGLSQTQASDRLGIKQGTLSKIERGVLPYNQDFLEAAALAYGAYEPADLLTIDPTQPRETDIVRMFRQASPEAQRIIETILRSGTKG